MTPELILFKSSMNILSQVGILVEASLLRLGGLVVIPPHARDETQEETRENKLSAPPALSLQSGELGTRCKAFNRVGWAHPPGDK